MDSVAFQDIIQYAPWLLVAFLFFKQNRMFVTPEMLQEELKNYVRKDLYELSQSEIKADMLEMKEKINKIYDKLFGLD